MHRLLVVAAFVVSASTRALAVPPPESGPCAPDALAANIETPADAKIAADGGIVVTTMQGGSDLQVTGDPSVQPAWRFRVDGKLVEPTRTTLAPGLTVYALPKGAKAATLEDGKHAKLVAVTTTDVAVLAAPKLVAAQRVTAGSAHMVNAVLDTVAPAGALGLVVFVDGKARSWIVADATSKSLPVWHEHGRCELVIPGTKEVALGDKITVAWVDGSGRRSAMSAAVVVAAKP